MAAWIAQAKEMGLTDFTPNPNVSFEMQIQQLSLIVQKADADSIITSDSIKDMSAELLALRKEEHTISSALFSLQNRQKEMLQLL